MHPNNKGSVHFLICRFSPLAFITALFAAFLLLHSCEEPSFVGLEIQPEEDRFKVRPSQETLIGSSFWERDSVLASGQPRSLLGVLNDPLFGRMNASFMTQVGLVTMVEFGEEPVADSLVLYLHYTSYSGSSQAPQDVYVYELNEMIDYQKNYFSNLDPGTMISPAILGSKTISRQPEDSLISIPLTDADFIDKLLFAPDTAVQSLGSFISYMKGLYVTALPAEGTGAIFSVNLNHTNSQLSLYYRNSEYPDSAFRYNFAINEGANRINLFEGDYTEAVFAEQLGETNTGDTVFYIQGGAGISARLDFNRLHEWRDSMPVSINSARLILPIERNDPTAAGFPPPVRLSIFERRDNGEFAAITDMALGDRYFGGVLDNEAGEYRFNISSWVQSAILKEKSTSIYVNVRDASVNPSRAVLRSSEHPLGGPRLEITYTRH